MKGIYCCCIDTRWLTLNCLCYSSKITRVSGLELYIWISCDIKWMETNLLMCHHQQFIIIFRQVNIQTKNPWWWIWYFAIESTNLWVLKIGICWNGGIQDTDNKIIIYFTNDMISMWPAISFLFQQLSMIMMCILLYLFYSYLPSDYSAQRTT